MGAVFGLFAAFYHWMGIFYGVYYSRFLGRLHFWITFAGVNITFFPMHFLGLAGMPRRIPDYPDIYWSWNFIASIGSYISGVGLIIFFITVIISFFDYFKIYNIFSLYLLHISGKKLNYVKRAFNITNIENLYWINNYKIDSDYIWVLNRLSNSSYLNICNNFILKLFTNKFKNI